MGPRWSESPDKVMRPQFSKGIFMCLETRRKKKKSSWSELVQRDLYDVLLDDFPLRDSDVLCGALLAAQPWKGAAPGQRERAAERRLHGLPTWHLPPPPRLPLQTLNSLQKTQQWGSEVKGAEQKQKKAVFYMHYQSQIWRKIDE